MTKVAIIGSGISGIAAAFYLLERGVEFDIIESSDKIGGRVGSLDMGGKSIDFGGKNIGYGYKLFREFVAKQDGDFNYEYFGVNTSKMIDGKVVPINREKGLKSLFNLLKLANPIDLLKILFLIRRIKKDPDEGLLGSDFYAKLSSRFDKKTLDNYFSKKCTKNILRPMTVRMNAAEPSECFLGNFGSNLRIAFDKYDQIKEGMKGVLESFCEKLSAKSESCGIFYNSVVKKIIVENSCVKGVLIAQKDGTEKVLNYDKVIVCTPAHVTSALVCDFSAVAGEALGEIKYNPLAIVVAKYEENVFDSEVRAMVFDEASALSNAGAYGFNDLDMVRYTFSGKSFREKFIASSLDKVELIDYAESVMPRKVFNIEGNKVTDSVMWSSDRALCSYSAFHYKNLCEARKDLASVASGLFLSGDYIKGASIEACFESSKEAVDNCMKNS